MIIETLFTYGDSLSKMPKVMLTPHYPIFLHRMALGQVLGNSFVGQQRQQNSSHCQDTSSRRFLLVYGAVGQAEGEGEGQKLKFTESKWRIVERTPPGVWRIPSLYESCQVKHCHYLQLGQKDLIQGLFLKLYSSTPSFNLSVTRQEAQVTHHRFEGVRHHWLICQRTHKKGP